MKRYFVVLIWMLTSISMLAVPAKRGQTRTITLADGTTVNARLVGDEHGHFWLADNGNAYQAIDENDYFVEVDAEAVKQHAQARRSAVNARRVQRLQRRRALGEMGSYIGEKKCLIILVNFSNVSFNPSNDSALYVRIANEPDFHERNFVGSMYDYFYAQSEGKFQLTFDVVGPVTMPKSQSYYGSNDAQGNDKHPAEMVHKAVELVKDSIADWKQYDWDDDGYIDQVYVVYAGKGEADGGAATTIWPHAWDLWSSGAGMVSVGDNLYVNNYACGSELSGNGQIEGIGTMCHEFSHCLGYPDFYDTDYSGGQGMDDWDLMSGGSYNGNGFRPAGYTSYERWVAGWKEPIELNIGKSSVENMQGLQDGGDFYVMYNDGHPDEYFLLENRTKTGWDKSLPGSGLLIIHVDYDAEVWAYNLPNDDPNHQRMTWIPSDGSYNFYGYGQNKYPSQVGNDSYPNANGNNAFNDKSSPAAELYNVNTDGSKLLHKGIKNITKAPDGTVSFDFVGVSTVKTPVFSPGGGRFYEPQIVSITCETEGTTIYYTTDGSDPTADSNVYTEPLTLDSNVTLKAMAATDNDESWIAEATYTFTIISPTDSSVDYLWKENFTGVAKNTAVEDVTSENAYYEGDNGQYCLIYNEKQAGGTAPEVMIPNKNRPVNALTANIAVGDVSGNFGLSFKSNRKLSVTSDTEGVTITSDSVLGKTYYYIVSVPKNTPMLRLTFTNANAQNARLDDIVLMKYSLARPKLSYSEPKVVLQAELLDEGYELPTLNNPYNVPVIYSSSNTEIADVDESTGGVTLTGEKGTAEITALFEGNDNYFPDKTSYMLVVGRFEPLLEFEETLYTTKAKDTDFKAPELKNIYHVPVTYESSAPEVAAVDLETGVVTIGRAGSAVIYATFGGDELYSPAKASYELVVDSLDSELLYEVVEVEVVVGTDVFYAPELVNPNQLPVVYSSSDETLAIVDDQGEVMLQGESGRVTITATFEGDDYYKAGEASYDIVLLLETGISTLSQEQKETDAYYTIQGVRVNKPTRGLYIRKGKKVVMK